MKQRKGIALAGAALATVAVVAVAAATTHNRADDQSAAIEAKSGYCVQMPDAIGLYVGNPVTQMGYQVGKVTNIDHGDTSVRVTFDLDGGRQFPADVQAVTRSKSLLADRSLELVGNYSAGATLEPSACIPEDRAHTPKNISEIAGSAADFIEQLTANGNGTVAHTISGLDQALSGVDGPARSMLEHAAAAAASPDQVTADIGSAIVNMAPLTEQSLQDWDRIQSIFDQMPTIAAAGIDLFPKVAGFDRGVGGLVAVIYDIQRTHGDQIWPTMNGPVADLIRLAATRAPDLAALYETVPSMAAALRYQEQARGGLSLPYRAPEVNIDLAGTPVSTNLLSLIIERAGQ
ncbi:MlaD family protein [Rhodococcus qingshengii]|uniref:MlaD family protein n=1 Tax=Rhodococcus qingshengii TaxID=334542 RepID=UPI0036D89141